MDDELCDICNEPAPVHVERPGYLVLCKQCLRDFHDGIVHALAGTDYDSDFQGDAPCDGDN